MSRIDELQRLHEKHMAGEPGSNRTATMGYTLFVKLHNSWPAIHRVLLAARLWDEAPANSIAKLTAAEELSAELRALDGDKGAT